MGEKCCREGCGVYCLTVVYWREGLWPGGAAFLWLGVYQDDVRADFLNAAPGDDEVVPASRDPQKTAWPGNHDGADLSLRHLDLYIADEAQALAVSDADDFLALQVGKIDGQSMRPLWKTLCAQGRGYAYKVWRVESEEWSGGIAFGDE